MKAFLLTAGKGTRLRPLTEEIPKSLIPIRGTPLLETWLKLCQRHGICDVLVNLHWKSEMVRAFLRTRDFDLRVYLFEEPELLGSAGTIRANYEWVRSEEHFWVLYGDVLTQVDLGRLREHHLRSGAEITLGLVKTDQPHRCGIAQVDAQGNITGFVEKPSLPRSNLAFSGICLAGETLLEAVKSIPDRTPLDLGRDIFPLLGGRMHGYLITEYLIDVGTTENYRWAHETWTPGR